MEAEPCEDDRAWTVLEPGNTRNHFSPLRASWHSSLHVVESLGGELSVIPVFHPLPPDTVEQGTGAKGGGRVREAVVVQ